jgi:hypothetical protein
VWDDVWCDTHKYFLLFRVSFFFHSKIKYEGPECLFMFFFYFIFVLLLVLLLIDLFFMLIIIYLCFFFSYFQFVLIVLCFGVVPSSKINACLADAIGYSGGAYFCFSDQYSYFICNGESSGYFLKGW